MKAGGPREGQDVPLDKGPPRPGEASPGTFLHGSPTAGREQGAKAPGLRRRRPPEPIAAGSALPLPSPSADSSMDEGAMIRLKEIHLAPYIQLATSLIGKLRRSGGNMFRHQIDTMAILMDYGYIDSILLKASVIHDLLEDIPEFDRDVLLVLDDEASEVYRLVLEVTRRPIESKAEFLGRIRDYGSARAQVLKCADRISNMISLGYVTDVEFIRRYTEETEREIFPIADHVDERMAAELRELVSTRREYVNLRFMAGDR